MIADHYCERLLTASPAIRHIETNGQWLLGSSTGHTRKISKLKMVIVDFIYQSFSFYFLGSCQEDAGKFIERNM